MTHGQILILGWLLLTVAVGVIVFAAALLIQSAAGGNGCRPDDDVSDLKG